MRDKAFSLGMAGRLLAAWILFSSLGAGASAQVPGFPEQAGQGAFLLELGGRPFVFGSASYERALGPRLSAGLGLGLAYASSGVITREAGGVTQEGRYLDLGSSQLLYANYLAGQGRHRLLLTAGLTHYLELAFRRYGSERTLGTDSQLEWNAGVGYQLSGRRVFGRFTGYVLSLPDPVGWLPKFMPWVGLGVGWRLGPPAGPE